MRDEKIISLIATGRPDAALTTLYNHLPMVRKMITAYGGTRQDAEDIFQEALIILCRKIQSGQFTLNAKLGTYLYSVCRYLWKDERLRRKLPLADDDGAQVAFEDDLPHLVEQERKASLAERALQELGNRCKELLLLFYHSSMSMKDIATRMGYNSENTVKNQKYKCLEGARIKLQSLLQNA